MFANRTHAQESKVAKRQRAIRAALAAAKFKDPPPVTLPRIKGLGGTQDAEGSR